MNHTAYHGILDLLTDTYESQGWDIPQPVIDYQCRILADMVDRVNWQPEPSYAERYMQIRNTREAINLGDTCWFTRAVFPELGMKRGLSSSYYVQLGQGCYERVLQNSTIPVVEQMCEHFEFLAEAAYTAIRQYGEFRKMWL